MNDELIEITRKELGNTLSKIFSAIPENTQFNISQFEMAGIIDSLFKTHGPSKEIVPLQPDAAFLSSDLANELSENKSFEYTTLEEVTADKGLNIKYLLRGALQGKYLLYHIHGGLWWPVPVMVLNDLYNGKENVSSKIWSISDRNWLPVELVQLGAN
ncbi:MAG: hypothetical protein D3914_11690 [Candidatus Electrothrix sp. LOE2]|nr:hypothetical protein [Candidatus Electrothrix sp. LOE2]